jgi:putative ABC transport system permease protein
MELARELLSESLMLSLCGGILGMGVCYSLLRLLVALAPAQLPRLGEIGMDPVVFAFAFTVSLAAGLLFGLVPVYKYAGSQAASVIRDGGRTSSQGRERHRARAVLVVAQVALAVVLLVGAGLMVRSFQALTQVDPGFQRPEEVLAVSIAVPQAQMPNVDHVMELYRDILRRVSAVPGVQSAAIAAALPMDGSNSFNPLYLEDRTYRDGELPPLRRYKFTAPALLGTLGVPMIAGRDFTWDDLRNRAPVVLISENLAREAWGDPARAIGKRVRESQKGIWREIVGVTGNERDDGLSQPSPKSVHFPMLVDGLWDEGPRIRRWVSVTVRSPRTGSTSFVSEVRGTIREANAGVPIASIRTLKQLKDRSMARTSFTLVMLGLASFMALLLGVVGIYGVISYSVSQRTREIGIRTALGATSGEVRGMFLRHAMILAGIGVVLGLGVSTALTRWMSALLYGVSPLDTATFAAVPVILISAASAAAYLPARRATLLDPMNALRAE